jgi:hypothetical protein
MGKMYFIFKVKIPQRSLWYATHRLMVMHPHTKYHWPISKDKNVMARTRKYYSKNNYLTLRSKVIMVRDTPPYGHAPTYQILLTYLERQKFYVPDKKILFKKQFSHPVWYTIMIFFFLLNYFIMSPLRMKGDILF